MSKSTGNVVTVVEAAEEASPTALRWFLLRKSVLQYDKSFSIQEAKKLPTTIWQMI
jgi:methionyl-tRNA synthetase